MVFMEDEFDGKGERFQLDFKVLLQGWQTIVCYYVILFFPNSSSKCCHCCHSPRLLMFSRGSHHWRSDLHLTPKQTWPKSDWQRPDYSTIKTNKQKKFGSHMRRNFRFRPLRLPAGTCFHQWWLVDRGRCPTSVFPHVTIVMVSVSINK